MKTHLQPFSGLRRKSGYALVLVVGFAAISLVTLAGLMSWSNTNTRLIERNNQFFSSQLAAEAATEKVLSQVASDFQAGGEAAVYANLANYRLLVPTPAETTAWDDYEFNNAAGAVARTYVARGYANVYTNLASQYSGLRGMASTYRVISNARNTSASANFGAIAQEVQVATVPVYQFAIFYNLNMEIQPGANMAVNGRVHSNAGIYVDPGATLTFNSDVTAVGQINSGKAPGDSRSASSGTEVYKGSKDAKVAALTLPIGTNNTAAAVRAIIEVPPASESLTSAMGQQRLYNKADIVINVTNNAITITSGPNAASPLTKITTNTTIINNLVKTSASFVDNRELKIARPVDVSVSSLTNVINLINSNPSLRTSAAGAGYVVYVNDTRTLPIGQLNAVRVQNGAILPAGGLTVATFRPMYVQGHFNAPTTTEQGTTNTLNTKPASLVGDAITVLSQNWTDLTSILVLPIAGDTTVNAAFLAGIVETPTYLSYSGGVENYPRFLENWSGKNMTYNGSMVVMFSSKYATGKWLYGGNIYTAPNRNWAFDLNFLDPTRLPPATPQVRTLIRGSWQILAAGTTNMPVTL
jgi:hypothetical protein